MTPPESDFDRCDGVGCYVYVCPTSGEEECLAHGGFDSCCGHRECPGNVHGSLELALLRLQDAARELLDQVSDRVIRPLLRRLR